MQWEKNYLRLGLLYCLFEHFILSPINVTPFFLHTYKKLKLFFAFLLRSDGRFQGRRFTNEDFTVTLPTGTYVCDIGTLTIWCRRFRAIFTRIEIPRNIFVSNLCSNQDKFIVQSVIRNCSYLILIGGNSFSFLSSSGEQWSRPLYTSGKSIS